MKRVRIYDCVKRTTCCRITQKYYFQAICLRMSRFMAYMKRRLLTFWIYNCVKAQYKRLLIWHRLASIIYENFLFVCSTLLYFYVTEMNSYFFWHFIFDCLTFYFTPFRFGIYTVLTKWFYYRSNTKGNFFYLRFVCKKYFLLIHKEGKVNSLLLDKRQSL